MMASENFEQVLAAAQAGASLHPAWKKFVNTRFFVAVHAPAGANAGHTLRLPDGGQPLLISEVRERLDPGAEGEGGLLLALAGADLVRVLPDGVGIAVALSGQTFGIAASRVAWIRKSIEATLAKAAQARAASAPAPAPASAPAPAAAPWPTLDLQPAGGYEELVFIEEEAAPAVPMLDRIGRGRALALGLAMLAVLGLAGQALLRGDGGPAPMARAPGSAATAQAEAGAGAGKAGAPLASQTWTSPDGAMTIAFPGQPDEDAVRASMLERLGAVRMRQFSAAAHSETYRVQVLDLGTPPADPEASMLALQKTLLGKNDAMTVPPMDLIFKGYPGRDIKAGQRLIRMVVVAATVYIATADADAAPASMARAGAFIGSLALTQ
ncbi:hypothetical protein [Massilia aquatica]|uniref:Uncharacterized protein n=1 Tax=Massilia aquatica TaxID=2609000 RepID=A0ABX0M3F4_9BURK|nr:hypothetical protein [Massilia aquatica]NHZ40779.1 hypothetical protein [Massilia aquatica]